MRILLTSESYLPYLSGVTVSVDALARGLGARGHEVMVLAPRPAGSTAVEEAGSPGPEPRYAWLSSYQLARVAPLAYRMPLPNPADPAMAEARRFAAEIVHAHSPFVTGLLARRLARVARRPLVFTHHTRFADYGHYLGPLARPGSFLMRAYLRRFWLSCAAIVAPSTELGEEIRGRLPGHARRRVVVIPSGIDVEGIRRLRPADPRPAAGWAPDTVVAASLGRLASEKSPLDILNAFGMAVGRRRDLRLIFIGGGPLEADLRRRAQAPTLEGRVHFTGGIPRTQALATLAAADFFVFASQTETQGLVLAEAPARPRPRPRHGRRALPRPWSGSPLTGRSARRWRSGHATKPDGSRSSTASTRWSRCIARSPTDPGAAALRGLSTRVQCGHACESRGPFRQPSRRSFRLRQALGTPRVARPAGDPDGLPPPAQPGRICHHRRPSHADQPLPLPGCRSRQAPSRPPTRPSLRAPARPSLLTARP